MRAARRAAPLTMAVCSACAALVLAVPVFSQSEAPPDESAAAQEHPLSKLDWQIGPAKVAAGNNATLDLPEGYVFLDAPNTDKFMEITQNTSDGRSYTFAPNDLRWFALLQFEETGYVKDDEQIDADALLESVRTGTERGNKERRARGWPEMHVTGWRFKPRYDKETNRLEWAIDAQSAGEPVTNFNTRILGRRGVTSVVLVDDPSRLDSSIPEFKAVLAGYTFNEGERYAEFKPGDKVAAYGLAALVAGGAAAAAAKSGLLKGLWKFLLVGGAALLAGVRALFKRKNSQQT
jgi:uncharacterized membrane-anchored protein